MLFVYRGRGSRSILKWLKSGTLVHDASYCSPIQLDGPEARAFILQSLFSCFSALCSSELHSMGDATANAQNEIFLRPKMKAFELSEVSKSLFDAYVLIVATGFHIVCFEDGLIALALR